jgi:DNA-binding CsgD family transcriptional regulator
MGLKSWRFQVVNHREYAFEEVLDALAAGILLTDDDTSVLYMNLAARHHVEACDAICIVDHHLKAVDSAARSSLSAALSEHPDDRTETSPRTRSIALPGNKTKGLVATVLRLNGRNDTSLQLEADAAVFLEAPLEEVHLPCAAFASLYGLTPAELRLLTSLSLTHDANKSAGDVGIRKSTVKTHLSHIYAKTATSKLADLLPLFAHSVLRHELTDEPSGAEVAG